MFPSEAAEQDSDVLALLRREGTFDRAMKVGGRVQARDLTEVHAFGGQSLFDFSVALNMDEIRRHVCPAAITQVLHRPLVSLSQF